MTKNTFFVTGDKKRCPREAKRYMFAPPSLCPTIQATALMKRFSGLTAMMCKVIRDGHDHDGGFWTNTLLAPHRPPPPPPPPVC